MLPPPMRWLCLLAVLMATGCSLALDTDRFRGHGADEDAGLADGGFADGGTVPDAGPTPLAVTRVLTDDLPEGLGSGVGDDVEIRPTVVVVEGTGLTVDRVTSDDLVVEGYQASTNGDYLAVAVAVPVDEALGAGDRKEAQLTLHRGGESVTATVTVTGLDELRVIDGDTIPGEGPTLYSRITVGPGTVRPQALLGGRLFATADITIVGTLDANGQTDGTPGAGGCAGGGSGQDAICGDDSGGATGQPGDPATGAGGGGGQGPGNAGEDPNGGDGGAGGAAKTGHVMTVGLRALRGSGGGGGAAGPSGGGGGGALALVSRGTISFDEISARGGPGGRRAADECTRGGAGGGSGGVVLLRAWSVSRGAVDVSGGTGTQTEACMNNGGAGASGFIFTQVPLQTLTSTSVAPLVGPTWLPDTPFWLPAEGATITITGVAGRLYYMSIDGGDPLQLQADAEGQAKSAPLSLSPGHREICLLASREPADDIEGRNCLAFAVLP